MRLGIVVSCSAVATPGLAAQPSPEPGNSPSEQEPSPPAHPGSQGLDVEGVPEGASVEIVAAPAPVPPVVVLAEEQPPAELPYEDGAPIPPGYELTTKRYRGLIIGGAVTAGVLYGLSAAVGVAGLGDGRSEAGVLLIPIAGPFIGAATLSDDNAFRKPGIAVGLGQAAGVTMLVLGLVLDKKVLQRTVTPAVSLDAEHFLLSATAWF